MSIARNFLICVVKSNIDGGSNEFNKSKLITRLGAKILCKQGLFLTSFKNKEIKLYQ